MRRIDWRALEVRVRGNRTSAQIILKISKNQHIMGYLLWLVARAQVRAQTFDARHWIDVITEMLFDYLIVNLDQKAEKIQLLENQKKIQKISKIFKFQKKFC